MVSPASYVVNYVFADGLFPHARCSGEVSAWGRTVILSDGDVVLQPRKIEGFGISEAMEGDVLVFFRKEEALEVQRRYVARHRGLGG